MSFNTIFSSFINEEMFNFNTSVIKKDILKIKSNSVGRIQTNYGGWQSDSLSTLNYPYIDLFKEIEKCIMEIQEIVQFQNKVQLKNYWMNVNSYGSFNRPHYHPHSVLSGVYYVNVPKNSGNVCFEQPIDVGAIYENVTTYNHYNSSIWNYIPKKNLCLIFPSYLRHYVEPNLNKKERISISFNYGF